MCGITSGFRAPGGGEYRDGVELTKLVERMGTINRLMYRYIGDVTNSKHFHRDYEPIRF